MPFVLDASVAVAWCFEDEASPYADRVQERLASDAALVPAVWALEVANVLALAERKHRMQPADVVRAAGLLCALPITADSSLIPRDLGAVLGVARTHQLTAYDAAYVELAAREGLPLATQDARLRAVASRLGLPLVE